MVVEHTTCCTVNSQGSGIDTSKREMGGKGGNSHIILGPVTCASPLRPKWDRDVPKHPNEEHYHRWNRDGPVSTPPPISIHNHVKCYLNWFDEILF